MGLNLHLRMKSDIKIDPPMNVFQFQTVGGPPLPLDTWLHVLTHQLFKVGCVLLIQNTIVANLLLSLQVGIQLSNIRHVRVTVFTVGVHVR